MKAALKNRRVASVTIFFTSCALLSFSILLCDRAIWFAVPALLASFTGLLIGFVYICDAFKDYETSKPKEQQPACNAATGFAVTLVVLCIIGLPLFLVRPEKPISQPTPLATATPTVAAQPARDENPVKATSSFVGWTATSNGRTWNSAPESAKRDLCRRLARVTTKGNSADFFYDALNTLYATTDTKILDVSLDGATRMIEAASGAFPESSRNY